jgi:hypothetical protein
MKGFPKIVVRRIPTAASSTPGGAPLEETLLRLRELDGITRAQVGAPAGDRWLRRWLDNEAESAS